MSDPRWPEIWSLYQRACELPENDRAQLLERTADAQVRLEVAQLLEQLQDPELEAAVWPAPAGKDDPGDETWLQPGTAIGRFIVTGVLGRGSSGAVYAGRDNELGRTVALKFSAASSLGSSRAVQRAIHEARAASALNHPNIVTVHDVLRHAAAIVIVMEWVAGEPLQRRCGLAQPPAEVAEWGRQIAGALAATHDAGIVHRDIKPENLMLRPDGLVKVLDFGLARAADGGSLRTQGGLLTGTLRYMSPEQTRAEPATAASDVFSLGIVLYELAAGVHPFDAASPISTAHFIALAQTAPPSWANPTLDARWDELLLAMLRKDPAQRPAARAVAARLAAMSDRQSAPRRPRPRRWRWAGAAAGILVAAGLAWAWWTVPRPQRTGPAAARTAAPAPLPYLPLSDMSGNEGEPAFSPSGNQVAFTSDSGNTTNRDIYIRTLSPPRIRRLTSDGADHFDPAWAPDESRIAFLRTGMGASLQIVTLPAVGSAAQERVVGQLQGQPLANQPRIAWSPDGRSLVVAEGPPGAVGDLSLYRLDLAGGARTRLTGTHAGESDVAPQFSPDGRRLAFLRITQGPSCALYVLDAVQGGKSEPRRLVASNEAIDSFQWMPDGRSLIYSSGNVSPNHEWQVDLGGGTPRPAPLSLASPARQLAVARHGGWVAYLRPVIDTKIWRFDIRGRLLGILPAPPREVQGPRYSPDGSRIVYALRRTGASELWISDPDGSHARQLTHQQGYAARPNWSPDGKRIVYESTVRGLIYLWLVSASGGEPVHLGQVGEGGTMPSWSRDGGWIYFCTNRSGRDEIWKRDSNGIDPPIQVTFHSGLEGQETFDGSYFYYTKSWGQLGLWRKPVEGGTHIENPAEEAVPELAEVRFRYWDMARDGIYYVGQEPQPTLRFFRFSDRKTTVLAQLPFPPVIGLQGFSVAPDGQTFLMLHLDADRTEIELARPGW